MSTTKLKIIKWKTKEVFNGYYMMKDNNQQLVEHYCMILFFCLLCCNSLHLALVLL